MGLFFSMSGSRSYPGNTLLDRMEERMLTLKKKLSVFVVLLSILFLITAGQLSAHYFYDDFSDGNVLTVSGFSEGWTTQVGCLGSGNDAQYTIRENGNALEFIGTNESSNAALAGNSILRGDYSATATRPFGMSINVNSWAGRAEAGSSLIGISLWKSSSEYAAIYFSYDGTSYTIGYAWQDIYTTYNNDAYTAIGGSYTGPRTLTIIHDGSQVKFFADGVELPATYDGTEAVVRWSTNIKMMIFGGGKAKNQNSGIYNSAMDDCLVRSTVGTNTESLSEILPNKITASSSVTFTNAILPVFDGDLNAGVDSITMTLPSTYSNLTILGVQSDYNSDGTLDALTSGGTGAAQYTASVSGSVATIRLGTRITNATSNKLIRVIFSADTPSDFVLYGEDFVTTVEGKHGSGLANATTGPTRLVSGDADSSIDSDTQTVKVYGFPKVEVAIDPYTIGFDKVNTTFNYNVRNASEVGNQGVTKLKINIPTGFELQGVDSLILNSTEEATAIQVTSSNIIIDYGAVGRNIPAGGGTDVVSMSLLDSITNSGISGPFMFTSQVDDAVAPVGWMDTSVQSGNTNGVMVTPVQPLASAYIKPNKIYTSVSNSTFSFYLVNNGSGINPIYWAQITLPTGFSVTDVTNVSSSIIGGSSGITISNGNVITISYSNVSKQLPTSTMDIITVTAADTITTPAYGRTWSAVVANADYQATAQNAGLSVDIVYSEYGSCSGKVYPLDVISSITIYSNGQNDVVATATTDGVTGFYQITGLLGGQYDVYAIGPGYSGARYLQSITITSNQNTELANIFMNQNALDSASTSAQERKFIDDPLTKITFPTGSISEDTFVTVTGTTAALSAAQLADIQNNAGIVNPSTTATFDQVNVAIQSSSGTVLSNMILKDDATLQIHYDDIEVTNKGWVDSASTLAIFYWDGLHWVKIGGTVDTANNLITASVRNLSGECSKYVVMGVTPSTGGDIRDVSVSPNPFTPGQTGFDTATLTFTLNPDKTYSTVKIRIFNLRGRKVRSYSVDGSTHSGVVPWDGRDKDGYYVKSGIYIYQITAGSQTYSGKIVLIR